MKISGIYQIQSKIKPERIYIGSAINIHKRWNYHNQDLRRNKHGNIKLQNHYNKYGLADLVFSVLLGCDKEDLIKTEQYFIDSYNPFFNICQKAGNTQGRKHSQKTKDLIRKKLIERGGNFSYGNTLRRGEKDSPEVLLKKSAARIGEKILITENVTL